jgi:hypothetical protein
LTTPVRWRIVAPHAIAWREWNGEVVVRAQSGSVHLLNPFASRVVRMLIDSETPLSTDDLSSALRASESGSDAGGSRDDVEASVEEFERLGLVEPGPS